MEENISNETAIYNSGMVYKNVICYQTTVDLYHKQVDLVPDLEIVSMPVSSCLI